MSRAAATDPSSVDAEHWRGTGGAAGTDAVYRGANATEVATGFFLPHCSDGRRLLGFAPVLSPCTLVLLLVAISVGEFVPLKI